MSSFNDALKNFTAEITANYGKPSEIAPSAEDVTGYDDENLGDLIAFEAVVKGSEIRGFANKTGVVLAKKNEYGLLFQAAHALDANKSLPAEDIARRMVWMMGSAVNKLVDARTKYPKYPVPAGVGPATIERHGNSATLRFFFLAFDLKVPNSIPNAFAAEVKVSADYKAQLTTRPGP